MIIFYSFDNSTEYSEAVQHLRDLGYSETFGPIPDPCASAWPLGDGTWINERGEVLAAWGMISWNKPYIGYYIKGLPAKHRPPVTAPNVPEVPARRYDGGLNARQTRAAVNRARPRQNTGNGRAFKAARWIIEGIPRREYHKRSEAAVKYRVTVGAVNAALARYYPGERLPDFRRKWVY